MVACGDRPGEFVEDRLAFHKQPRTETKMPPPLSPSPPPRVRRMRHVADQDLFDDVRPFASKGRSWNTGATLRTWAFLTAGLAGQRNGRA
ncbi:unnamed protein product [Ectocarpus sp. CCAP 1310/34]|nr:unnamed protein product [Ectocarpus sp. CCAP 1310/34]